MWCTLRDRSPNGEARGAYEVGLGGRQFDHKYFLITNAPTLTRDLFSHARIRRLVGALDAGWSLYTEPMPDQSAGTLLLTLQCEGGLSNSAKLASGRDLMVAVLERLRELGVAAQATLPENGGYG